MAMVMLPMRSMDSALLEKKIDLLLSAFHLSACLYRDFRVPSSQELATTCSNARWCLAIFIEILDGGRQP